MAALVFASCKPTEKGYRGAYDAALAKRERAAEAQMRPSTGLLTDGGPMLRMMEGDSIYVQTKRLYRKGAVKTTSPYLIYVGKFKMPTNARSLAANLENEGYSGAFHAVDTDGFHYSVAGGVSSLDSARLFVKEFVERHPGFSYVGLPGNPVINRQP